MTDTTPTNHLAIYLIKDECDTTEKIIDEPDSIDSETLDENMTLYYTHKGNYTPKWVATFFGASLDEDTKQNLFSAYVSAVLLTKIKIEGGTEKTFAITFGLGGWHMLKAGCFEERFGLMCTLNLVSPTTLKSIEKSNMGLAPKQSQEQVSQEGEIADFGIDIEQDLIRSVTGKCLDKDLGSRVTGKDSLHVSVKADLANIKATLKKYYAAYISAGYKTTFGWIDHVQEIKDWMLLDHLNRLLDSKLDEGDSEKIWLAVPDVIEWSDIDGFYFQGDHGSMQPDLYMKKLRESYDRQALDLSVENLKAYKAYAVSASNGRQFRSWRQYNCLYAEITDEDTRNLYILSNGKWYAVENDFVTQVNQSFADLLEPSLITVACIESESEEDYNKRIASTLGYECLDRKLIQHGGGNSKIEFCDLFDASTKKLFHVKKYGGSSVLSHLFNQGLVSAELMLSDADFRTKVNAKLSDAAKFSDVDAMPVASEYTVIYSVISGSSKQLDIPFFSKVSLRNAKRRLEMIGYKVSVQKIDSVQAV